MPEFIVCLEDGKKLKMLKRHLATRYNMTPARTGSLGPARRLPDGGAGLCGAALGLWPRASGWATNRRQLHPSLSLNQLRRRRNQLVAWPSAASCPRRRPERLAG